MGWSFLGRLGGGGVQLAVSATMPNGLYVEILRHFEVSLLIGILSGVRAYGCLIDLWKVVICWSFDRNMYVQFPLEFCYENHILRDGL